MWRQRVTVACLALGLGVAPGAAAQERPAPRVAMTLSAGGSVPVGASREALRNGLHAAIAAEVRSRVPWLDGRIDVMYQRFGWQSSDAALGPAPIGTELRGRRRVTSSHASTVLRIPRMRSPVRPYAVAGVGVFHLQDRFIVSGVEVPGGLRSGGVVRGGLHAGAGVDARLGDVTLFAEARYERIGVGRVLQRAMPISLGLRF